MSASRDAELRADAARNNAELCDAVSRAHGVVGELAPDAWTSTQRTPPLYPDAVTLVPDVEAVAVLDRIDQSSGASVKDSFASLDLAPHGFRILFSAKWIARPAGAPVGTGEGVRWSPVEDGAGPELVVLRGESGGAVLNASEHVVGVSNLVSTTGDLDVAWASCLDAIARGFRGLDVVGYESDEMLDAAHRAGFRSIGPLRVWIKD